MAAISSWVSKVSEYQHDMITEENLETEPLLLNSDQTSAPLCPDKQPIPNNTVKSILDSSLEKPCIPSPNAQKSTKYINIEKSSKSCSVKHPNRPLKSNKPTMSSSPKGLYKSSHREKTYKKGGLKKSNKLNHAFKFANVNSSCSEKQTTPWLSVLQSSANQTTQPSSSISYNQITPTKPCRIKNPNLSHGHYDVKRSMDRGQMPTTAKLCRHYKVKCFVCNTGYLLDDISGEEKNNEENLYGSMKVKPHLTPFYDTGYKRNTYQKNVSNDTMKEYDSEDSNAEIVLISDVSHDDITKKKCFQY